MSSALGSVRTPTQATAPRPQVGFEWKRLPHLLRRHRRREVHVTILHAADLPPS